MPDVPRFSVTIPAYDAEPTLEETVSSVRAQTFDDWELVIVDDGSTDGTRALAERLAAGDERIRVISQENRGSGGAYNTAVRQARSDLLVMLSADDLLLPEHLETFDSFITANPDAGVYTCDGFIEYEDGRREPQDLNDGWRGAGECTLADLLGACFFGIGAVYRREVYDAVGGFREDIYAEDYLFWLLALAHGYRHRFLGLQLAVHRRSSTQKSANAIRMRQTDALVISEVIASGLLEGEDLAAARRVLARHRRTIVVRKVASRVLGPTITERLIGWLRPSH
jgi:glycosyltransferase involved in cell wall biosynthesis